MIRFIIGLRYIKNGLTDEHASFVRLVSVLAMNVVGTALLHMLINVNVDANQSK